MNLNDGTPMDTFDNPAPILEAEGNSNMPGDIDTFDNDLVDQDEVQLEGEEEKESPKEDPDVKGTDSLEDQDGDDKEEEEGKEESKDSEEESEESEQEKRKQLSGKVDGKDVELDPETMLKAKVDGKLEDVSVQDLLNNYSGRVGYDKKFAEIDKIRTESKTKLREAEELTEKQTQRETQLKQELTDIIGLMNDEKGNPLDGVYKLLDSTGQNRLEFEKRLFANLAEQFENYQDMDDVERRLFWTEKELAFQKQMAESTTQRYRSQEENRTLERSRSEMRETNGISEEQFNTAHRELMDYAKENGIDPKTITDQHIVEQAITGPLFDKAANIVSPFVENLDGQDELVTEVVSMLKTGDLTEKEITEILKSEFGEDLETQVEEKIKTMPETTKNPSKKPDVIETFDDFDY